MESKTVGRVLVEAKVENLKDLWELESGQCVAEDVRGLTIEKTLVDTGATTLSLPATLVQQLGLKRRSRKRVITSAGESETAVYDAVRLTILGRKCTVDVMKFPDGVPALIGQVPLELLDFVVDPGRQRLIGNPEHGGEHIIEVF